MSDHVVLLSVPGLRAGDVAQMPNLSSLIENGDQAPLVPSFPCVTCPVQANMLTGQPPREHGVVANGRYQRDARQLNMWNAGTSTLPVPTIWDILHQHQPELTSAAWFPMPLRDCGADYMCTVASPPVNNNTVGPACYTRPTHLYAQLCDELGPFPSYNFWRSDPLIDTTSWIASSAIRVAQSMRPHFFYLYLPHLGQAARRSGPDSPAAFDALSALDAVLGKLFAGFGPAYEGHNLLWLVASEYVVTPVDHVSYPNRRLRQVGLLQVKKFEDGEHLDLHSSQAWAFVDHQFSHVYLSEVTAAMTREVTHLFARDTGIDRVVTGNQLADLCIDHAHSGDVILISSPNSWQAYDWWMEEGCAPPFARTRGGVNRQPASDPVELYVDRETGIVPFDARLVRGSHGAPAASAAQRGVLLSSQRGVLMERATCDTDVADVVLRQFGI